MAGFSQSTPGKPRSAVESIMLLLAAGIGSGVMVPLRLQLLSAAAPTRPQAETVDEKRNLKLSLHPVLPDITEARYSQKPSYTQKISQGILSSTCSTQTRGSLKSLLHTSWQYVHEEHKRGRFRRQFPRARGENRL